jgi:hypothetical protein
VSELDHLERELERLDEDIRQLQQKNVFKPAAWVPVVLFFLAQTAGAVWWAADQSAKVGLVPDIVKRLDTQLQVLVDHGEEIKNADRKYISLSGRVDALATRLTALERLVDRAASAELEKTRHESLTSRIETLEARIVGRSAEGWHRTDHEAYAESIERRLRKLEDGE